LLEILSKPTTFGESTQRVVTELLHAFSARLVAEFFDNLAVPGEQVEGMRQRDVLTAYIEGIDELRRAQFAEDAADAASAVNDDWDRRLGYVR
jgi:cytochrome P450